MADGQKIVGLTPHYSAPAALIDPWMLGESIWWAAHEPPPESGDGAHPIIIRELDLRSNLASHFLASLRVANDRMSTQRPLMNV
jgi:hypothetical protein